MIYSHISLHPLHFCQFHLKVASFTYCNRVTKHLYRQMTTFRQSKSFVHIFCIVPLNPFLPAAPAVRATSVRGRVMNSHFRNNPWLKLTSPERAATLNKVWTPFFPLKSQPSLGLQSARELRWCPGQHRALSPHASAARHGSFGTAKHPLRPNGETRRGRRAGEKEGMDGREAGITAKESCVHA